MFLIGCQAEFGPWGAGTLPLAKHLKSNILNADPKGDSRAGSLLRPERQRGDRAAETEERVQFGTNLV